MDNTQAEIMTRDEEMDLNIPLQKLFDECLNFISVSDFIEV